MREGIDDGGHSNKQKVGMATVGRGFWRVMENLCRQAGACWLLVATGPVEDKDVFIDLWLKSLWMELITKSVLKFK
eukprot:scaffold46875_cov70-Cyclotella_meneghiniana.AAC.2